MIASGQGVLQGELAQRGVRPMHFRQSGQRAERRRRVLVEEAVHGSEANGAAPAAGAVASECSPAVGNYDARTLDTCRYRLTDLIPTRLWTLTVLGLTALALIAGVQSLYGGVLLHPGVHLPPEAASALDVSARGSLAGWLSAMLLGVAAAGSWLLFVLRRHRMDDYRGHYRIWIWASAGLLFASVDAGTRLHAVFAVLLTRLAGTPLHGAGAVWWMILYGLVLGGLAVRMLIEMWPSRLAVVSLLATGVGYALAACVELAVIPLDGGVLQKMLGSSLALLAHASLLGTVVLYARHVYLDAQGKLAPRVSRRKARQGKSDSGRSAESPARSGGSRAGTSGKRGRSERVDAGHAPGSSSRRGKTGVADETDASDPRESSPKTAPRSKAAAGDSKRTAAARSSSKEQTATTATATTANTTANTGGDAAANDVEGDEPDTAGLSKAERRRLRKQRRRQKQEDTD